VWTGIEYQVAGNMVWDGMLTEALAICRAIHERYHPSKHNPCSRRLTMMHRILSLGLILLVTGPAWSEDTLPEGITARAWAIADGRTGELLWGLDEDKPAKAASTTKMMCAWVVLRLAEADPAVWDQTVTYSKFAAATAGSSSRLREGESVSVAECLYGLLLPSGNDAGNALAEHFNGVLEPPTGRCPRQHDPTSLRR
jgi:D-alanyl-D-alanine carboxypeptidase